MVEWGEKLDPEIRAGLFGNRLDSIYTDIHQYLPNQIFLPLFYAKITTNIYKPYMFHMKDFL